ncbi:hypothetical protein Zmor_027079 [Zophobas morio]|uniref:phenylalanine--tRNA ligase n=1 Tax=Zophobas morio TaxID=2755281 RepID=A0AA38HJ98_9CUCU|nr:hypothetical protein Zmor_027079 [Zophobas morio]
MDLKKKLFEEIKAVESLSTLSFAKSHSIPHQDVVGALKSLEMVADGFLKTEISQSHSLELTSFGCNLIDNGKSPEFALFKRVEGLQGGVHRKILQDEGLFESFNYAKMLGWVDMDQNQNVISKKEVEEDICLLTLQKLAIDPNLKPSSLILNILLRRKALKKITTKYFIVQKGPNFKFNLKEQVTELTEDMIKRGIWKDLSFKKYNFIGGAVSGGHLHPLLKVRAQYREKFLEMGFTEMPTNQFVESSFWNFDALFQPQKHPARDAHDTFFLADPAYCSKLPEDYMQRVKQTHESGGGTGSLGYRCKWSEEEARKNLLRTHTTAVTARMLKNAADMHPFRPVKYFSIDRVFRNETTDSTHLAEFHQVEGVIVDYNLSLGDLIGILHSFFLKLGIASLRFKPAYNPYTEPSMEIFSYHAGLKKWVEVGNSGMFRPEMLEPMGLPSDVRAIAWGLSLERPAMIMYGIDNIRDLVGHKVDLKFIRETPICSI